MSDFKNGKPTTSQSSKVEQLMALLGEILDEETVVQLQGGKVMEFKKVDADKTSFYVDVLVRMKLDP